MSSLPLHARNLLQQSREFGEQLRESLDQSDRYRIAARDGRGMQVDRTSQDYVFGESEGLGESSTALQDINECEPSGRLRHWRSISRIETAQVSVFSELPQPDLIAFDRFVHAVAKQASQDSVEKWNRIFAYTDFGSMPFYISILTLAAAESKSKQLPVCRVFVERCRNTLRSMGIAEKVLDWPWKQASMVPRRTLFLNAAYMVACLEQQTATHGYLSAAIEFEKLGDSRSALACVYRNVRYRLRDNQVRELDDDVRGFDVTEAGVDSILALLTATAPVKSSLSSRKSFFRNAYRTLKKRGLLERGLLDGLK
ncbi:MAG: hypothetical protein IT422_22510 [Pirellulaceae bacterium]|nr:hypothetical protein [Pirellulaceae bacterium]